MHVHIVACAAANKPREKARRGSLFATGAEEEEKQEQTKERYRQTSFELDVVCLLLAPCRPHSSHKTNQRLLAGRFLEKDKTFLSRVAANNLFE